MEPTESQSLREKLEASLDDAYTRIGIKNLSREQGMPLVIANVLDTISEHIATDAKAREAATDGVIHGQIRSRKVGGDESEIAEDVTKAIARALKEQG